MILLYATDLIFTTRIRAEASAAGAAVEVARGVERLGSKLAAGDTSSTIVLVDLDADGALDAVKVAAEAAPRPRIVCFVSHVRADLAAAARAAGAGEVMARSAFVLRLPALAAEAGAR